MSDDFTIPRTLDVFEVISRNLQRHLDRYPKGALIPRQEVCLLPVSDEASFAKVDAALTSVIVNAAVAKRSLTSDDLKLAAELAITPLRPSFKSFRKDHGSTIKQA